MASRKIIDLAVKLYEETRDYYEEDDDDDDEELTEMEKYDRLEDRYKPIIEFVDEHRNAVAALIMILDSHPPASAVPEAAKKWIDQNSEFLAEVREDIATNRKRSAFLQRFVANIPLADRETAVELGIITQQDLDDLSDLPAPSPMKEAMQHLGRSRRRIVVRKK